jgi:hypothetical protein
MKGLIERVLNKFLNLKKEGLLEREDVLGRGD